MTAVTHFHRILRERINAEIADVANDLANGNAQNYEMYSHMTGHVGGLKVALRLCEDIERDLDNK